MKWALRIGLALAALLVLWLGVIFTLVGEVDTTPNFSFGFISQQWSSMKSMVGIPAVTAGRSPGDAEDCPGASDEHLEAAAGEDVLTGMSPCLVRRAWGEPDEMATVTIAGRQAERWAYRNKIVLFENDLVVGIEDRTP